MVSVICEKEGFFFYSRNVEGAARENGGETGEHMGKMGEV